ncbi:ABC transporter substrate-binding protein [Pigmentibacter ruber]|uniref:ABC transporter substrate-binding protein n=1 Tax=Pigmentibacter ruber TaxID=2683196 RepID=UPI00131BF543|nr:hypothetical protein [Pigmentibacter ruber]
MIFNCDIIPYAHSAPINIKDVINPQILDTLVEIKNGSVIPKILKNAYFDFTTQEYVLEMYKNTKFHNNRIATLDDLEFSLTREYYTYGKERGAGILGSVLGIEKIGELGLKKYMKGKVKGIKQEPPNILRIKLEAPDPDFLFNLAKWELSLVPMEELSENYLEWRKYPIGTGIYKVVEPGYQNGLLKLVLTKPINLNSLTQINIYTNSIQNIDYDLSILNSLPNFKILKTNYPYKQFSITFVNTSDLSKNYNFRKFVQLVIDKKKLEKIIMGHKEIKTLANKSWLEKEVVNEENLKLIKGYLEKIPFELMQKEWFISVYSGTKNLSKEKQNLVNELISQLKEYGFNINYKIFNTQHLPKDIALKTVFDLSYYKVNPFDYLYKYLRLTKNSEDIYSKPEYDATLEELYKKALYAENRDIKFKYINELDNYVTEKAYWIPLLESEVEYYYNPKTIEKLSSDNDFLYLKFEDIVLKN